MANEGSTKPTYSELEQELADERLAFNHANDVVGKLEAENLRVRGLLQRYGQHLSDCNRLHGWGDKSCDCGLTDALSQADGE